MGKERKREGRKGDEERKVRLLERFIGEKKTQTDENRRKRGKRREKKNGSKQKERRYKM